MNESLSRMEILNKIHSKKRIRSKLVLIVLILFIALAIVPLANYFIQLKTKIFSKIKQFRFLVEETQL